MAKLSVYYHMIDAMLQVWIMQSKDYEKKFYHLDIIVDSFICS